MSRVVPLQSHLRLPPYDSQQNLREVSSSAVTNAQCTQYLILYIQHAIH